MNGEDYTSFELLEKYQALLAENSKLKEEIRSLKDGILTDDGFEGILSDTADKKTSRLSATGQSDHEIDTHDP